MSHLPEKLTVLAFGILLVVNTVVKSLSYKQRQRILGLQAQQQLELKSLEDQRHYWLEVVTKNPDYRDGYLKLAEVAWQQDSVEESKTWIAKALEIDPNYVLPTPWLSLLSQ